MVSEIPLVRKVSDQTLLAGVFAMGPLRAGRGQLQKPGGKYFPEMAKGEGIPSQVENNVNTNLTISSVEQTTQTVKQVLGSWQLKECAECLKGYWRKPIHFWMRVYHVIGHNFD